VCPDPRRDLGHS
jgi:hypothetical protein